MAAIDPTVLTLLSIFGGALLTAAFGVWGAWKQSRREHTRWIRERRYDAYREFVAVGRRYAEQRKMSRDLHARLDKLVSAEAALKAELQGATDENAKSAALLKQERHNKDVKDLAAEADALLDDLRRSGREATDRVASFHLLGPGAVTTAARKFGDTLFDLDTDHTKALQGLEAAMRDALGVDDYWPTRQRGRRGRPPATGAVRSGRPAPGAETGRAGT